MKKYDVIVCGGGPSGVVAAVSAKRNGAKVLIIESSGILGGNTTQSLVSPWMTFHDGGVQVIKGIASEIVERLVENGNSLGHISDPIGFADSITPIDTEGVKGELFKLIDEEEIDILLHAFISGVTKLDNTLTSVQVSTKSGFFNLEAKVFVDATGDGDVAFLANEKFQHGRESDNLTQPMTMMFHLGDVDIKRVRKQIDLDHKDFHKDENYVGEYTAASGFFSLVNKAKKKGEFNLNRDRVLFFEEVRDNQVSINMTRVQNKSGVDVFDLTDAEIQGRKQIQEAFKFLKNYVPGFENSYILRTPSKIGVRETRHILGEYTITLEDLLERREFFDSICVAAFPIDIHSPSEATLNLFEQTYKKSYEISLRTMIPKTIDSLIVTGRCISASHEANASLRVTPSAMALGEAAGVLAALSAKFSLMPREVDYRLVQKQLIKQGQIIKKNQLKI